MNSHPTDRTGCGTPDEEGVLRVDEALRRMVNAVESVKGFEQVGLLDAHERVLDETVIAPFDVPGHANAAMDGFALRTEDLPGAGSADLAIIGASLAGHPFPGTVERGQAVRITTGAPLPVGADTVIMVEHVEVDGDRLRFSRGPAPGANVRAAGEDLRRGETILSPGRYLTAPDIGLIASVGFAELRVKRRPRVALLSTGDELYPIGRPLAEGCLYDSNRYCLHAALKRLSVKVMDQGIVPDDAERLREALLRASVTADVVITSGGVSVGSADFVKDVLTSLGTIDFWRVAMKPGRPIAFGRVGGSVFIGLPGNPVSALVGFYQFALPVLEKKMGITERPLIPTFQATSVVHLNKSPGRTEFQRGILERTAIGEWEVRPTGPQGSGMLRSMSIANAVIILRHDRGPVEPGEPVEVLPFAALM